jgi:hypothetical protein
MCFTLAIRPKVFGTARGYSPSVFRAALIEEANRAGAIRLSVAFSRVAQMAASGIETAIKRFCR